MDNKKKWTKEIIIAGIILVGVITLLVLIIGRSGIKDVRNQSSQEESSIENTIASSTEAESEAPSSSQAEPETSSSIEVDSSQASNTTPENKENTQNQTPSSEAASSQSTANKPDEKEKDITPSSTVTCYIEIRCDNLANDLSKLTNQAKAQYVPAGGVILPRTKVEIPQGQNVEYLIKQVCKNNGIQLTSRYHSEFKSDYVSSIANIAEFDAGQDSGWMFSQNGIYVNTGVTNTTVNESDVIIWNYTCNLGGDLGTTM